jgi:hypothetical protein
VKRCPWSGKYAVNVAVGRAGHIQDDVEFLVEKPSIDFIIGSCDIKKLQALPATVGLYEHLYWPIQRVVIALCRKLSAEQDHRGKL